MSLLMFVYIGRIWEGWVRLGGWICYIPQFAVWYSYSWDWGGFGWDEDDVRGMDKAKGKSWM